MGADWKEIATRDDSYTAGRTFIPVSMQDAMDKSTESKHTFWMINK